MAMRSVRQSGAGLLVFWAIIWPFWPSNLFLAPKIFKIFVVYVAKFKIPLIKFSYLVMIKVSSKNIEKWRRSRKKLKVHFRKIAN